jgi:hypothetical protein
LTPTGYAGALGLPQPTLWCQPQSWPIALLCHDHLGWAQVAAEHGLVTAGQLLGAEDLGAERLPLPIGALRTLRARYGVVRESLVLSRIGRGRPLTGWNAVLDSGAVSGSFQDRVRAAFDQHAPSALDFVTAVGELKGFRNNKRDVLEAYLEEQGHLDRRAPLETLDVVNRAGAGSTLERAEVEQQARWVRGIVGVDVHHSA